MSQEQQEKKNRRIGMLTSLGIHGALLLLFIFAMAWRAPDPPLPEFGIVLNVGFDDEGSGDIQTDEPATEPVTQDTEPAEEPVQEEPEPVVEDKPVDKAEQQEVIESKVESPVTVKKQEEKVKEEPKKEEPKKEEPKKEPEKLKTEYKPDPNTPKTDNKGEKTESEGDDKNKTGNKGEPEGTLDPNGQYTGKPGGGGGGEKGGLSMSGWKWTEEPSTASISNNENGRIVFEIECDEDGEIIGLKTLERGVSAATEQILRREIMGTSLTHIGDGAAPPRSKGRMTFVIKSR